MTGSFSVKLKSKKGQFILNDINSGLTIADLKARIAEVTQINEEHIHILIGFPPRPIDLSQPTHSIESKGIKYGETLIIEEKKLKRGDDDVRKPSAGVGNNGVIRSSTAQATIEADEALARRLQEEEEAAIALAQAQEGAGTLRDIPQTSGANPLFNGILLKKVVPADNSCLFTSIRFVLNGKIDNEGSEMMRHIIAQEVAANPSVYNDAMLGKSNPEYCAWIQKPESWGGAIEVSILSNYYGMEIDVVDVQNAIINRFGEDKNYGLRVFLLFDGIHYDPLYMESPGGGNPATIFPVEEMGVYHQAEQIANEAKSSRQFTNVDKFTLRCMQCDVMLVGQVQAQQHAKSSGHTNFGEI